MDSISKSFTQVVPETSSDQNQLKSIALICGAGLLVTLLCLVCGVDFSAALS